jgi:hypothetical protein
MEKYIGILNSYSGYFNYLKNEILYWKWDNYFYGLIASFGRMDPELILFPWRKQQAIFS